MVKRPLGEGGQDAVWHSVDDNGRSNSEMSPLYEYKCVGCGLRFEIARPMAESSADAECPECGQVGRRVFSRDIGVVNNLWSWVPDPRGCSREPVRDYEEEAIDRKRKKLEGRKRW